MPNRHIRKTLRDPVTAVQFQILVLEQDEQYAHTLKLEIESQLRVQVATVHSAAAARLLLTEQPNTFFLGITSAIHLDSDAFEKVDLLGEFNIPIIAIVSHYEDEMRDQLIKRHVIDYVVKGQSDDITYICELIVRVHKNTSIKVLIVDDSKVSQFVIARELMLQKFNVLQATNGIEALDILHQHGDVKLVLVDHQMSMIDGITFVQKARVIYPKDQLLIIGISTSSDPRLAVKFLKAGANDFISKPFNYEILLCRINQNLDMLDAVEFAKHLSNIDYLSNVFNRRYFFEHGDKIFKTLHDNSPLTVMMMDIDFFKKVNDVYGHDAGDEVIKHFAQQLKAHFHGDIVARLGGEEFAVLSQSPIYLTSFEHIDAFRAKLAGLSVCVKQHVIQYTCSIGATNILRKNLNDMMIHADRLLYNAKRNGRNRVEGKPAGKH
ncbi:diguanylate cyclase [Methylotenera sp. 1P/1]|uniref:GGDEF domain-containing response regulator n=1 Tax=Methylotenera sp. 1P/1 TaxID=1131551 RepID=UPI00037DFC2C|nr:diguanylate cyclase [Methylotenera sp. 1P/1]